MSNVFSLDDMRAALDAKYAPVEIMVGKSKVVLTNIMRLGKLDRVAVQEKVDAFQSENELTPDETFDLVRGVFLIVAEDDKGQLLNDAIGEDIALAMNILEEWLGVTQVGEASGSQS